MKRIASADDFNEELSEMTQQIMSAGGRAGAGGRPHNGKMPRKPLNFISGV